MRTIAHISDLHFGQTDPAILGPVIAAIKSAKPDLVVVSGDLTQRARAEQFQQAANFLREIPFPQIVVPGNHDVPLYNVVSRWLTPLDNYRRYICSDLSPWFVDEEIAVCGLNTARSWSFKDGRINQHQVAASCQRFASLPEALTRIVVTHHPFATPPNTHHSAIGRADIAMAGFTGCKVDIILSGHLHLSHAVSSNANYAEERSTLLVQAGTATSSRRRDEPNSFNILRIDNQRVRIDRMECSSQALFRNVRTEYFKEGPTGWNAGKDIEHPETP